MRLVYP